IPLTRSSKSDDLGTQIRALFEDLDILVECSAALIGKRARVPSEEYRVHLGNLVADTRCAWFSRNGDRLRRLSMLVGCRERHGVGAGLRVVMLGLATSSGHAAAEVPC